MVKSVLKVCVSVASLLCGELLPYQAWLLHLHGEKGHPVERVLAGHGTSVPRIRSVSRMRECGHSLHVVQPLITCEVYFIFRQALM